MKERNNGGTTGGVGFVGLLQILFIGLKLGKVIDWSWLWVLSPLWISISIWIMLIIIIVLLNKRGGGR